MLKRVLLVAVVVLALPAAASASYQTTILADSPDVALPLDETSGTTATNVGSNGSAVSTFVNTPTLGAAGVVADGGTAVHTTASSSEDITVSLPQLSSVGSIEFWFKWTGGAGLTLARDNTAGGGWIAGFDNSGTFAIRIAGTSTNTSLATSAVQDGNTHHFVLAKSGASVKVYVDNAQVLSLGSASSTSSTGAWHFGRNGSNATYSDVTYDWIAIYTTQLSAAQVAAHYAAGSATAAHYYVSPTGSDSNNGTSTGTPWQTIAKVNAHTFIAGDEVSFQGGQTFTGQITPGSGGTSINRVIFDSYGTGRATITNTGGGNGILIGAFGGFTIQDLDFTGPGVGTSTASGINLYQTTGSKVTVPITIQRVNVSAWRYGISIGGDTNGYDSVLTDNAELFGNRDWGYQSYGAVFSGSNYANSNLTVRRTNAYSNLGDPLHLVTGTGNGIIMGSVATALVETSSAYDNGVNNTTSAGPVGIWTYDSNGVTIRRSVSYSNKTSGANDGGGFDLDQNVTNALLENDLAYDNDGYGFVACPCDGDYPWNNNTIRGVASVANDKDNSSGGEMLISSPSPARSTVGSGLLIENSTFLAKDQSSIHPDVVGVGSVGGATFGGSAASVTNNMFVQTGTGSLVEAASNYTTSSIVFSSNGYRRHSSFEVKWPTATTYTSKAAWSSATGQEP